jgi:hypothetical protein
VRTAADRPGQANFDLALPKVVMLNWLSGAASLEPRAGFFKEGAEPSASRESSQLPLVVESFAGIVATTPQFCSWESVAKGSADENCGILAPSPTVSAVSTASFPCEIALVLEFLR